MENFLIYLLKASIGIMLFYFFYYLVLRKETFYVSNRLYLIAGLILAVLLPAFPINYTTPMAPVNNADFFTINEYAIDGFIITNTGESGSLSVWSNPVLILSAIYLLGTGFFLLRLVLQTALVAIQLHRGKKLIFDGVSVIGIKGKIIPFSFFNTVIINSNEYSKEEMSNIIAHEKVHIQERHWVDLLIIELLTVLFWINPIVWLYEKSIKQNHEYLADQGVLLAGYNPGQYQALLINQLMGEKILGFTNNLNFSLNKKRMEMMKKEKSPEASKMKLLLALPVIALLVFAFAKKEYVIVDAKDNQLLRSHSATAPLVRISGIVQNGKAEPLRGINILIKGTTTGTISDISGKFVIEAPKDATLVFSFVGYEIQTQKVSVVDRTDAIITMIDDPGIYHVNAKPVSSDQVRVSGVVQNDGEEPLSGIYIVVKGTTSGTITNNNGRFIIDAPANASLVFSFIGYATQTHKVSELDKNNALIKMSEIVFNIELPEIGDEKIVNTISGEKAVNNPPPPPPPKEKSGKEIITVVEDMPFYKEGGMYKLAMDIRESTSSIMEKTSDRGEAVVGFTVTVEGIVTNVHIVKSADSKLLDASAIKIVERLNNWNPGIQRGKKVPANLTVPVSFNK